MRWTRLRRTYLLLFGNLQVLERLVLAMVVIPFDLRGYLGMAGAETVLVLVLLLNATALDTQIAIACECALAFRSTLLVES